VAQQAERQRRGARRRKEGCGAGRQKAKDGAQRLATPRRSQLAQDHRVDGAVDANGEPFVTNVVHRILWPMGQHVVDLEAMDCSRAART